MAAESLVSGATNTYTFEVDLDIDGEDRIIIKATDKETLGDVLDKAYTFAYASCGIKQHPEHKLVYGIVANSDDGRNYVMLRTTKTTTLREMVGDGMIEIQAYYKPLGMSVTCQTNVNLHFPHENATYSIVTKYIVTVEHELVDEFKKCIPVSNTGDIGQQDIPSEQIPEFLAFVVKHKLLLRALDTTATAIT